MKNLVLFLISLIVAASAFGSSLRSNDVWNAVDGRGTNALAAVDSSGNLRIDGGITSSGALTSSTIRAASEIVGTSTIQTNATIGGTLTVTGVVTFVANPKLPTASAVTGTPVAAAGILLPEGYSTNAAKFITITVGTTNYVIPVYVKP